MRRNNTAGRRRRKQPAVGAVAAKGAKHVKQSDPVDAVRKIPSQVAKTSRTKQTLRDRAPGASKNAPGAKPSKSASHRDVSISQKASEYHSTWTVHRGVSVESWGSTPSAEPVEARVAEKAICTQSEHDDLSKQANSVPTGEPLPERDVGQADSPAGLACIVLTEDDSNGQPDCNATQDQPGPGPDSTQLVGVTHSDPSGVKIHLKPADSFAEAIVHDAISFLFKAWRPEAIPTIFSLRYSFIEKEDESIPNVRIISSGGLIPTARFVEEILARSRTTPAVLKVAMTYLETLLPQLPELQASCAENVSVQDFSLDSLPKSEKHNERSVILACLPSPLLCPRRMFLAALMLAWKFVEDIFIPNREWAILADLPVWEVSRCERALGNALDWQLWPHVYREATLQNK